MNTRFLLAIVTVIGITAAAATAVAAPLPAGTKLFIEKGTDGTFVGPTRCTNGSCFGMYLFAGLYAWTPFGPGSDGGLIIGKGQKSGGQEVDGLSANNGELTEMWVYGNNNGTFFTAPSDTGNVFDDQSCTGSGCGSNTTPIKTALKVWNTAWGGLTIPMGGANGCNPAVTPACTTDQMAGIFVNSWTIDPPGTTPRKYRLVYSQVVPAVFTNYPFELVLSGTVSGEGCYWPITVTPASLWVVYGTPQSFSISVAFADSMPTCRVGTPPSNGVVVLNNCTSGTYTADGGFIGTDSFTLIANDGRCDSLPAQVNVAVIAPTVGPSPTFTPMPSPTPTSSVTPPPATPTPTIIVDGCPMIYPVSQATLFGKQGHLTITVTGNIVSVNPNGKEIKICPMTTASYEATTNTPNATVVCKVKSNTSRGQGHVSVNDHIKCTDKPVGNDKLGIKIKSGVNQKAM